MEFNPNFTYMLKSVTAEDNVCHKDNVKQEFGSRTNYI
jgi:hypothetical protein